MLKTDLSADDQQRAQRAFRRGFACLMQAKSGETEALAGAIIYLKITLEWALPETWPALWLEARTALNEALQQRGSLLA